jgi:membrane protein
MEHQAPELRVPHFFRICLRIIVIMRKEFSRTHLAIRASALTYAILLSLVPILALTASILKGLGNDEHLKQAAIRFITQLEAPVLSPPTAIPPDRPIIEAVPIEPPLPTDPASAASPTINKPSTVSATTHLYRAIDLIFQYVDRTNFATLGIVGVLGLICVVLFVLASIEEAMNVIWHTRRGRPLFRKLMDYMAVLILLPLSLNIALAAEAMLASQRVMEHLAEFLPSPWMVVLSVKLLPFSCTVLTLMIVYLFFPHVKVKTSAALTGAVFATIFWFIFQKLYVVLQVGVANYNAIYGSFASIPLFLIWLQIGWTFILLGASLAYAMQHHQDYQHATTNKLSPERQLQIAFDLLQIVYDNFAHRLPTSVAMLCESLPQSRCADIKNIIALLHKGQLLNAGTCQPEDLVLPVTPADRLISSEVLRVMLAGEPLFPSNGGQLATRAIEAAAHALETPFTPDIVRK